VIDWLAAHRRSIFFVVLVAVVGGAIAAWRLPVSLFPIIDFPRVVVSVDAGDRPVDRMVIEVTRPLEQALRAVPDVLRIRSTSSRGAADLSVNFNWGTDMVPAMLQLESAANQAVARLPAGTRFEVRRMDPTVFPVLGLTLRSTQRDLVSLRDLATYQLQPLLAAVPGVAQVEVLGGRQAEYQVFVDPARMRAAGVTLQEVTQALSASNVISAVGRLEDRYRLYLAVTDTRLRGLDDIAHTALKSSSRGILTLNDVADIQLSTAPEWSRVTAAGGDAVLVNIRQSRGANTPALMTAVTERLRAHAREMPADVRIGTYYDQSELIRASATSVRDAILIGAALSGLILLAFLRDLRLMLVIAIVLPSVLLSTTLLMTVFGMSFNIMTLGGMAASVGLVVDDAVVMVEHLMRRRQERASEAPITLLPAAREMLRPLVGSSLATVVIFVPLAFLGGVTGGFFRALALTMAAALVISLFVALTMVPLLTDWLTRSRAPRSHQGAGLFGRLRATYEQLAGRLQARPAISVCAAIVLVIGGVIAFLRLPSGFMPPMDEGGFVLDYFAAPGTSLAETDRLLRQVEQLIVATPEVDNYSRRTGVQLGGGLTEANEGDFFIHLKPLPRRDIEDVMADLRAQVETNVPGLTIETMQLMEDVIGDLTATPQPIEVKLFGAQLSELQRLAPQVAQRLEEISGVVEVLDGLRIAGDAIAIRVDRASAAREGLDPQAVSGQVETFLGGTVTSQIQTGEKLIDLRVWSPVSIRERVESIRELRVQAPDGHELPLKRIATVEIETGQPQIVREDLEQMIAVTARLEGRDLGSAMREVRAVIASMALPASVRVEFGGLYAEQQESFRGLIVVFAAAVLLVAALLLYLYERIAVTVSVLLTVLLSVAAVLVGLWLTGTELNISALMGMTMIVGIVTEIAIFFFAEIDMAGAIDRSALATAGRYRLRPILMTAIIAILALLPLALGLGTGAAMQTPLAIAIICGLVAALPLVLLVMPALYLGIVQSAALLSRRGPASADSVP
jgi:CzcA family heavy metal efflux pump